MRKETGGPAFPTITSRDEQGDLGYRTIHESENGMTLERLLRVSCTGATYWMGRHS